MELNHREKPKRPIIDIVIRVSVCLVIVALGFSGMKFFSGMKKPPAEATVEERMLQVEAVRVERRDFPVSIRGYGELHPLTVVPVAPEVSGKIIGIHPRLEAGAVIKKGEVLFRIDPRAYEIISRRGGERLMILRRNMKLAQRELKRVKTLYETSRVGTRSGVESAETAWLSAADLENQVTQAVETANLNLARCEVLSPFNGRVREVSLEKGQYVSTGSDVLTLVDDSVLEISVPIDSIDARKWLRFDRVGGETWFSGIRQVPCEIRWTDNEDGAVWTGMLHRVIRFANETRMLTVAVRADPTALQPVPEKGLPLVDGMFCSVTIPGKAMLNVIRLPRWAVTYDNTVYTSVNERLKTVAVSVARVEGDFVYVAGGINDGDTVIVTRLVDPLENSLLNIKETSSPID